MSGLELRLPSPMMRLRSAWLDDCGVNVYLKREDLIHPNIPGNKWRKLKYNIAAAQDAGAARLLTFGGAYSNHIRAVSAAGELLGFETIGVIRGEPVEPLNEVLSFARERGMRLTYMDRATYRLKDSPEVLAGLRTRFGDFYLLPEGGSNKYAVRGCAELVDEIDLDFDTICCPCGTGGTLAGVAAGLQPDQSAVGFAVLKGGQFLNEDVRRQQFAALGRCTENWTIETEYHFGGYAKRKPELMKFIDDFHEAHGLMLDWVYVAKMMYGLFTMIAHGHFEPDATVVALVTGVAEPAD